MADTAAVEVEIEVPEGEGGAESEGAAESEGGAKAVAKEPTEIEVLAADMGWAPEDKWRGTAENWVDAKTFIKTGPEILKSSLRRLDAEAVTTRKTMEEFKEHYQKADARAYKRARADLEAKQRDAVTEGDTEAFDRVTTEIKDLDPPAAATPPAPNPDADPAFIAFQAENLWYGADGDFEMTLAAEDAAKVIGRQYQGAEFYTRIATSIRAKFPDKFKNPARREPARVDGGGDEKRGGAAGNTFANLPVDAKATCKRFVAEGLMTEKQYVSEYFEDES